MGRAASAATAGRLFLGKNLPAWPAIGHGRAFSCEFGAPHGAAFRRGPPPSSPRPPPCERSPYFFAMVFPAPVARAGRA